MPSTTTKNLTLSRCPFHTWIGHPEGFIPFIRHLHLLHMQHRKAHQQLIRTVVECCKEHPDQSQTLIEEMSDDLMNVLKPTDQQKQDLIGLWDEYRREIFHLTSPIIEAKVEQPDPSFVIENLTDEQWQKVEDSHLTPIT